MDTNAVATLLLIAGLLMIASAFVQCYLGIKCILLKKENRIYRRFFEQQYHLESDCMDACCEMVRESTGTTNSEQGRPRQYTRRPTQPRREL